MFTKKENIFKPIILPLLSLERDLNTHTWSKAIRYMKKNNKISCKVSVHYNYKHMIKTVHILTMVNNKFFSTINKKQIKNK
jgi:hypothetical protein